MTIPDPGLMAAILARREELCGTDSALRTEFYIVAVGYGLRPGQTDDEREDHLAYLRVPRDPAKRQARIRAAYRKVLAAYQALIAPAREDRCEQN